MDKLFGNKPWIEPILTASSDQTNESTLSDENVQSAKLLGPTRKSKDKILSSSSRQALLEYRKLRAVKKDEQHKEKMDLLKNIKNLIQETLQKEHYKLFCFIIFTNLIFF